MSSNTSGGYTCDEVWEMIRRHQGEEILTAKGLPFTYTMKGGELFISRRTKSITRSTFEAAWNRVMERPREITGPKKLNVFGAPYLWAVFKRLELVPYGAKNSPGDARDGEGRDGSECLATDENSPGDARDGEGQGGSAGLATDKNSPADARDAEAENSMEGTGGGGWKKPGRKRARKQEEAAHEGAGAGV